MSKATPWTQDNFWQDIDTVLLDMDGTLLDLYFDNYFWQDLLPRRYSEKMGIDQALSFKELSSQYTEKAGTLDWYCVDFWADTLELDLVGLKYECAHLIQFRPGVKRFLDFLNTKNIDAVLATNAHRKALDIKMERCSLSPWIEHMHSSHDFGFAKEHQQFWHELEKVQTFDKSRCLLIDDNEAVLDSAKEYGLAHVFSIEQPDSQRTELNQSKYPIIQHFDDIYPKG